MTSSEPVRFRPRRWAALAIVCAATGPFVGIQPAAAATTPPWEPSSGGAATGTITFYDSSGTQVTTGHLSDTPFAKYAVASAPGNAGDTKAELYGATPVKGTDPANWSTKALSIATKYPNAAAPGTIGTTANPVVTLSSTNSTLADLVAAYPNTGTDADYANIYQLRLLTFGPDNPGNGTYFDADILVNPSAGTWSEIYPDTAQAGQTTTTVLTADPANAAPEGSSVELTATETAADSTHPAGSVTFESDGQEIGSVSVPVDASGVATLTTASLPAGAQTLSAVFVPNGSAYSGSTGTLPYRVDPVATKPTVGGKVAVGHKVSCSESADFGVVIDYAWTVNDKKVSTKSSYTIPASAYHKKLACLASVHVTGGPTSTASSTAKTVAKGSKLKATKSPTITGSITHGHKVKVAHGTWSPKATTYAYQWYVNGKAVKHATKSSFKIPSADKGKKLACKVIAKLKGYASGSKTTKNYSVK